MIDFPPPLFFRRIAKLQSSGKTDRGVLRFGRQGHLLYSDSHSPAKVNRMARPTQRFLYAN